MGALAVVHVRGRVGDDAAVRRMQEAVPHRGREHAVAVVGSTAVGIVNDAGFRDTWLARDGEKVAAFSGTLDNSAELVEMLRLGAAVDGRNPAQLLIAAFARWHADVPSHLRGIFAAVISDGETLHCFRDHLGFRSLFFRDEGRRFVAGSEAKQVVVGARIPRTPDAEAVHAIFFGRLDERTTALKGVERLPKATSGTVERGALLSLNRYWSPAALVETAQLSVEDVQECLPHVIERAVARSVTGNDAVSLSGGIDSTAIAAFAAPEHCKRAGRPLVALSSVYPTLPSVDEKRYIELVADRLGLRLHTYVPRARPLDELGSWVELTDGPWDTLLLQEVAEHYDHARRLGIRTVLSGELAEYVYTMSQHVLAHLLLHGRFRAARRWATKERELGRPWLRILRRLAASAAPPSVARRYVHARKRDHRNLPPWIEPAQVDGIGYRPDLEQPARRRWLDAQLVPVGPGVALTVEVDELCAAWHGVHVRRPLADVDLWEFFLSLPAQVKFPSPVPKSLIRNALRGRVPDEVLDRRDKTVFDDHLLAAADYDRLRSCIFTGDQRIEGVDYRLLRARLNSRELGAFELLWAYDLARAHAFLNQ